VRNAPACRRAATRSRSPLKDWSRCRRLQSISARNGYCALLRAACPAGNQFEYDGLATCVTPMQLTPRRFTRGPPASRLPLASPAPPQRMRPTGGSARYGPPSAKSRSTILHHTTPCALRFGWPGTETTAHGPQATREFMASTMPSARRRPIEPAGHSPAPYLSGFVVALRTSSGSHSSLTPGKGT